MSEPIFAARAAVEQAVRTLAAGIDEVIKNAVSEGLYPDGLSVNLNMINGVAQHYLTQVPDTSVQPEPEEI
ncbi:MAG: hypothetical protein QM645_11310 [Asticcacaulis sp.]